MKLFGILNIRKDTMERPSVFGEGDTLFRYNFASKYAKKKKVLNLGTGYRDGAHYLFSKGAKEVVGIDNVKAQLKKQKKVYAKRINIVGYGCFESKIPKKITLM